MKKQKLLMLPALVLAIILALCGCEIDLTNLVTDVILITSKEVSSDASSEPTAEISSAEESAPSESAAGSSHTATSDTSPQPSEWPEPEPTESEPASSEHTSPPRPASSEAPVSSEAVSSQPPVKPSTEPLTNQPYGPWPHPWLERDMLRFPIETMQTMQWSEESIDRIRQIGVTYSTVFLEDQYGGLYTDRAIITALLQLLDALETDAGERVTDHAEMGVETCPVSFYYDNGTTLVYCPTFYLRFAEDKVYIYEYWQMRCTRYEITNLDEIRPQAQAIYAMITGRSPEEDTAPSVSGSTNME